MRSATMVIDGMSCGGCVVSVKRVLERVPGVSDLQVEVGEARLTVDDALVTEATLRQSVERAGFEVEEVVWSNG
ncbi:MAG: heavy-metal-associated domain-containing protein [Deltaproteobacteria bacterium]|jgi:copper chaperone|nr:heavy-metal-associated domain-containing protein [Deltaproteobacteria bacterium]MBK8690784.1 heavy-metal-associated domain-containing protein [Deltaproteobacteria bacterium]MBP6829734.1 heavy-metal-associated domain-containing protein [Deltaproteobacteria bacterium]